MFTVVRVLVAAVAAASLTGCASDGPTTTTDPCASVKAQAQAASDQVGSTFADFNDYTHGFAISSATAEGQRLGEQARQAMLTLLNLIKNSPDCFSETEVAQAASMLTTWEQPGTVPAPTATPSPHGYKGWLAGD